MPNLPRSQSSSEDTESLPPGTSIPRPSSAGFYRSRSISRTSSLRSTIWQGIKEQGMKSAFSGELGMQAEKPVKPFGSSGNLQAYHSDPSALRLGQKKEAGKPPVTTMEAAVAAVEEKEERPVIGVLSKWVNLGRGWGPRLFVLEKGLLSYFRIEGPDKASIATEIQRRPSARLIGEEVKRCLRKEKENKDRGTLTFSSGLSTVAGVISQTGSSGTMAGGATAKAGKEQQPHGVVHLKVSSLRESMAEERKLYVYSGTKRLDLRAETAEDRNAWMEALQASKEALDSGLRAEEDAAAAAQVSLEGVRAVLQSAAVSSAALQECEEAVRRDVVAPLLHRLQEEQRQRQLLLKRLGQLQADKVELESAVVEETRQQGRSRQARGTLLSMDNFVLDSAIDEVSTSQEEDDDEEEEDVALREGDEEFFEAVESFKAVGRLSLDEPGPGMVGGGVVGITGEPVLDVDMEKVGFSYPKVLRRDRLPVPAEVEKSVSLWHIIKDCVGKDISKICLPVYFNEPISTLQKCCEEVEYSWLLDRAYEYGRRGDHVMRALHVAAFAVSGYTSCAENRVQKPFNPLIGETFEADFPDKGVKFLAEKVVHHPPIVACHCEGQGWRFFGDCDIKIRFWGPSMQLDPMGVLTLEFDDGERFEWGKVTSCIYNIILGKLYIDHYGTMKITGNRGLSARLRFKERSMFDRDPHQVRGFILRSKDGSTATANASASVGGEGGERVASLTGKWDSHLYFVPGDLSSAPTSREEREMMADAQLLWKKAPDSPYPCKYTFSPFCITLNEITPGLEKLLPPTDSRLRPDQRHLENGYYDDANAVKLRLEQKQRAARKAQQPGWQPRWFRKGGPHNTWLYNGGYWEAREKRDWSGVKDIFADDENVAVGDEAKN